MMNPATNPAVRALILLAGLVVGWGQLGGGAASAARWGADYFPNLPVVTHEGETVRFYDDLIDGKIVVVNFVYTSCPDICSLSTSRMAWVQDQLGDRLGRDIFIYSITLDPENDTPEVLKAYAEAFAAKPGWLFLTGRPEDIGLIRHKLGERSRKLSEHRSDMVLGNGATGEWRRTSLMGNLAILSREILDMDPEIRDRPRPVTTAAAKTPGDYAIRNRPGQALFLKGCASCHSIGEGDRVGPDLMGVADRRDRGWLLRFLVDPDGMRLRGDPTAVALDHRYPGVSMPDLGLSEVDAADVLAYLVAETRRLAGAAARAGPTGHGPGTRDHRHQDHNHHDHPHHDNGDRDGHTVQVGLGGAASGGTTMEQ